MVDGTDGACARARERAYRERAERLDAERELHAQSADCGERARIARELHDVIAHSVSVMVIQAGGARIVMDTDPGRAEASLRLGGACRREALAEMRRLLGVLDAGGDPRALAPQPGLAEVEGLLARTRAAGLGPIYASRAMRRRSRRRSTCARTGSSRRR